jgi:hypothetical protein
MGFLSPDAEEIIKLADFFDISADYLLCRSDISHTAEKEREKSFKKSIIDEVDSYLKKIFDKNKD